MSYLPHQEQAASEVFALLRRYRIAYLNGAPRSGKTRTAARVVEMTAAKRVLVLTKKAAITGWLSELDELDLSAEFVVTNYEQAKNVAGDFDLLILDEAHNLGTRGKPTQRVKAIRKLAYNLPLLCLSGTPVVETPLAIYHQWCVSKYSPFDKYRNFYAFFRDWGVPNRKWIGGRDIEPYDKAKPELMALVRKYTVTITQDDAGIKHQATDKVHQVTLKNSTKTAIADILKHGVYGDYVFDSDMGVRTAIHQMEYGAVLYENEYHMMGNLEVVDYCLDTFGDTDRVAFFTHFKSTRELFRRHFKNAPIYSSVAHAEGFSVAHLDTMVVVNTGYSGAKFIQLRERLVNINRQQAAVVHHITTDAGISSEVYNAVSDKRNWNLASFRQHRARTADPGQHHKRAKTPRDLVL